MDERTIQRIVDTVMSVLSDDDPDNADVLKKALVDTFWTSEAWETKEKPINEVCEGQLEIDRNRGVIYFHSAVTGHTLLRICRIPDDHLPSGRLIDLTIGYTPSRR